MDNFKISEVAINLELIKQYRFYHMLNPNCMKIKNWNVYQLVCITFTAIIQLVVLYATFGFFYEMDDAPKNIDFIIIIAVHIENYTILMKMIVVLYKANTIWELFDVTRFNFLTSELCCKNIKLLIKNRDASIKLTRLYSFFTYALVTQWIIFPSLINTFMPSSNNQRLENICNFRFPVTLHNYNQYYIMFWAMEFIVTLFYCYGFVIFDVLLMSFCYAIKGQYEVLTQAFEDIGFENGLSEETYLESLKSVIRDLQKLNLKLKSFYSVWKPIVLIFIAVSSTMNIVESLAFILNFLSAEDISILTIFKLGCTILYNSFQLYMHCYLFELVNLKKELVNFGIYSCDWTRMNLKFQKLILLTMNMNNANQLMIKASPNKIVNLQLFAGVMKTSYNMVSVLVKTTSNKMKNKE